jgi:hypothetical protein
MWQNSPFLTEESTGASGAAAMAEEAGADAASASVVPETVDMPTGTMAGSVTTNGHKQPAAAAMPTGVMDAPAKEPTGKPGTPDKEGAMPALGMSVSA